MDQPLLECVLPYGGSVLRLAPHVSELQRDGWMIPLNCLLFEVLRVSPGVLPLWAREAWHQGAVVHAFAVDHFHYKGPSPHRHEGCIRHCADVSHSFCRG